jgi:beta-glucosidase/6-phospho-beta-glucosidase/beta-galactosidase
MKTLPVGPRADQFVWASGVEDTFVPQTRPGHRSLDEYELMGHYHHWREDLALARDLGVQAIRWGVPWYRVEPRPGEFDWRWIDQVFDYLIGELGITPVVDLMHYGCPFWLRREFAAPEYPTAVAKYAAAFARRYAHTIRWYTPLNEPLVNALMCGKRGLWPPYLRGDRGYIRVMTQLAHGIVRTVEAIKEVDPLAIMVHVEAAGLSLAVREDLRGLAVEEQRRGYLCYDLITGRITSDHPLFEWLLRSGATPGELEDLTRRAIKLDVIGLNFYPQWSTTQLYVDQKGRLAYKATHKDGSGFTSLVEDYYRRYRVPVMITETSAFGEDVLRSRWLEASLTAVKQLRGKGVPVIGYTWFPMFTMIDWRYRFGRADVNQYRIELGLYRLNDAPEGARWLTTPLVEQWQRYVANPEEVVGTLTNAAPLRELAAKVAGEHSSESMPGGTKLEGMHSRRVTIPENRYLIYYTFDEAGDSGRRDRERHSNEEEPDERYV